MTTFIRRLICRYAGHRWEPEVKYPSVCGVRCARCREFTDLLNRHTNP